ncbi:class I SAM-dependent methyltransferase [Candidatus Campbellbacteria bacterium]|nr:MAG: class I SAM-dependent methyltransferase [Candidatus Campbellbacteria bacterium]
MNKDTQHNAGQYDEHALEWEDALKTNVAHKYMEKPAMEALLPADLSGMSVLCIGVGSGEEIDEIQKRGAAKIVGIDISEQLLASARAKFPQVEFFILDMIDIGTSFEKESFNVVYSSLAFHYASDWDVLLAGIHTVLKPQGMLVFSTHHPAYWGTKESAGDPVTNTRGVTLTKHTAMLGNIKIVYYNHPNEESIIESVEHAHFKNISYHVPKVVELSEDHRRNMGADELQKYETLKEKSVTRDLFLVVRAEK